MKSIVEYLGCGKYCATKGTKVGHFIVSRFSDIFDKIVPFFEKYPLQGVKGLDFADFCKVAEVAKNKRHLTEPGLEEIRLIKAEMNRGRSV